nr:MAG TPA: actin cytoskeleton-regulatory complex protein [Caudoviricetes sp.]
MIGGGQLYTSSYAQISSQFLYFLHIFNKNFICTLEAIC